MQPEAMARGSSRGRAKPGHRGCCGCAGMDMAPSAAHFLLPWPSQALQPEQPGMGEKVSKSKPMLLVL